MNTNSAPVNKGSDQFPSDYVSRDVKCTVEYTLLWTKAIEQQINGGNVEISSLRKREIANAMNFYHGNQGSYQYMQKNGLKQDEAGNMVGYSDMDWTPISFMGAFIKSVYAYLSKETYDYEARGLDENSIKEKERLLFRKLVLMKDKAFFERLMGREITERIPASEAEFRIAAEEPEKALMEVALEQHLQAVLRENRFDLRLEKSVVADLIYSGYFAIKPYYLANGRIAIEWVDAREVFMPRSRERDFSDISWVARVRPMTLRELKAAVKDRTLDETAWDALAYKFKGTAWATSGMESMNIHPVDNIELSNPGTHTGRYDHFVIPVMEAYRLSTEYSPYEQRRNPHNGEMLCRERPFDYEGKGEAKRVDREWVNVYGALYVPGSDQVFNTGPVKNLVRTRYDRSRPTLPILITKTHSDSINVSRSLVEVLKPLENFLQTTWMKLVNEAAEAKPDITWLEIDFITNGIMKGVDAEDAQEAIDATFQTGKLVGSTNDGSVHAPGRGPSAAPAGKIPGGLGSAFRGYVEALQIGLQIMERVVGRSAMQIGQTPHPDTGKGVMEQVVASSNEMLQDMVDGYQLGIHNLMEVITEMIMRLSDYRTKDEEFGYRQVFSQLTNDIMLAAKGMHTRTMGIFLQKRMTEQEMLSLLKDIQDMRNNRVAQRSGGITEVEYLELRDMLKDNPRKARRRLKFRATRREAIEQAMGERSQQLQAQSAMAMEQGKAQVAAQKIVLTEEQKRETLAAQYQLMGEFEMLKDQIAEKAEQRRAAAVAAQSKQDFEEDMALQATEKDNDKLNRTESTNNVRTQKI